MLCKQINVRRKKPNLKIQIKFEFESTCRYKIWISNNLGTLLVPFDQTFHPLQTYNTLWIILAIDYLKTGKKCPKVQCSDYRCWVFRWLLYSDMDLKGCLDKFCRVLGRSDKSRAQNLPLTIATKYLWEGQIQIVMSDQICNYCNLSKMCSLFYC